MQKRCFNERQDESQRFRGRNREQFPFIEFSESYTVLGVNVWVIDMKKVCGKGIWLQI